MNLPYFSIDYGSFKPPRVDQNLAALRQLQPLSFLQWPWNGAVFSVNEKIRATQAECRN
jgi:hypothetical protein